MAKIGCLLIIVAFLSLCVLVIIPVLPFAENSSALDGILQSILCGEGETIQRDQFTTSGNRGGTLFTMGVDCVSENGESRDVTENWTFISAAIFAIPFLLGLFAFIGGVTRIGAKTLAAQAAAASTAAANTTPVASGSAQNLAGSQTFTPQGKSLTERLKEIQDARNSGMITPDEYERLRREILDSNS